MTVNILNWGIPALLTVVVGTGAALATSGASVPADLHARAEKALDGPLSHWASVRFVGRDAFVSGTAANEAAVVGVVERVAQVHGVRSVTADATVATSASPYPFEASVADGVLTLSGAVPDSTARAEIMKLAGPSAVDKLEVMGGAPDRATWMAAIAYALQQLAGMDAGTASLSDLDLRVGGRARDDASFAALTGSNSAVPEGVTVSTRDVEPALASPYEWHLVFDGSAAKVSGDTPDRGLAQALAEMAPADLTVTTDLRLASGAPEGFVSKAEALFGIVTQLEQGTADISDGTVTISGLPATTAIATAAADAAQKLGATATLGAPRVADYTFSAVKHDDRIVLGGYVPDDAARTRLSQFLGVDASGLQLGRGAPDHFQATVDLLLGSLAHMSDGTAAIDGDSVSLSGRAGSAADYAALQATVAAAPDGVRFASTDIHPPLASPFTWQAEKAAGGGLSVRGYVPSPEAQSTILDAATQPVETSLTVADGAPDGFVSAATNGLAVLQKLSSGTVAYDGSTWTLKGSADSPEQADAASRAFDAAGLAKAGWTYQVAAPAPVAAVDPYRFELRKAADGAMTASGYVPGEDVAKALAALAPVAFEDRTRLGSGAPDGFQQEASAGLAALKSLRTGALSLVGDHWALAGTVGSTAERQSIQSTLGQATDTAGWHIAIQAADAAPVVFPFTWSATKDADGRYALSGYVPNVDLKHFIAARAKTLSTDDTLVGSGEPSGFAESALAGLDALSHLDQGEVAYDGTTWSLTGQPATDADQAATIAALKEAPDGGSSWSTDIAEPVPAAEAPAESAVATATAPAEPAAPMPTSPDAAAPMDESAAAGSATADQPTAVAALPESTDTSASAETAVAPASAPAPASAATDQAGQAVAATPAAPATDLEASPVPAADETGQGSATVAEAEPTAAPEVAESTPDFVFEATKSLGGAVSFAGSVPTDPARAQLAEIVGAKPSDKLSVTDGLPPDFETNADAGARALVALADGNYGLDHGTWVLTGRAVSDAQKQAALANLDGTPAPWRTDVTMMPPVAYCDAELSSFAKRNAILFQSGSAKITSDSGSAIDELAGYLKMCPDTDIDVDGHTDSDGDADANLALSVDRAEAVVEALIARGIAERRLYAIGYGETLPIASNDTAAGKQANRRIAFGIHGQDD